MLSQIKQYLINFWLDCQVTLSKKQMILLTVLLCGLGLFLFMRLQEKPAVIKDLSSGRIQKDYEKILVDISGEVKKPGVYELRSGSRLYAAVLKAGGLKKSADRNSINLAQELEDGQKVVIASKVSVSGSNASTLININSASAKELEELPGIGETIAERIVQRRESDGAFKKVDELNDVEGIGPKKFEQVKELVSVF